LVPNVSRQICKEIIEKKANMVRTRLAEVFNGSFLAHPAQPATLLAFHLQGSIMKDSFFSYTNAIYAAGEGVKHTVLDNVETASVRVAGGLDNVAGVKIPKFTTFVVPGDNKMDLTGECCMLAACCNNYYDPNCCTARIASEVFALVCLQVSGVVGSSCRTAEKHMFLQWRCLQLLQTFRQPSTH
jgi:hypothetical protein